MTISANLGFPRIGKNRELKRALEAYWADLTPLESNCSTPAWATSILTRSGPGCTTSIVSKSGTRPPYNGNEYR